jgi:tetratricopeptide (TPR) repeat protein/WD40 repeat protein
LPGQADLSSSGTHSRRYYQSVARIGVQAAEALAHAHQRGIVHRDVKPSNLMLDTAGIVWVTDFGLALTGDAALTQTGDLIGTLRYMAPERFRGLCDARADVYALGLTLYELLTLRPAFDDPDRLRLVERIGQQEPSRPRALDPHVPRDLETVVLKAIAKEPARRYPSAQQLADDLRRFLEDRPIRARRTSVPEQGWRWCRRNPALAATTASVAALLVAIAVLSAVSAFWLRGERDRAAAARGRAEVAEQKARLREAEALVGQAHGTRLSRRPGQRFEALEALGKAAAIGRELGQAPAWFDRLRHEAIAALALPDVHITKEIPNAFPPETVWVELSEDFELYARTTDKGGCTIRRVADDTEVARLPDLGEKASAEFGSGRILAVSGVGPGRFQLWDLSGAEPVPCFQERNVRNWHFRRDGQHLVLVHGDASLSVYDVATGRCLSRLAPAGGFPEPMARLHPTEPLVAVCSYLKALIQVRDWRTGAVVASATSSWRGNSAVAWSLDGRTLTAPDGDSGKLQQYAFDPAAPALRPTRLLEGSVSGDITYNPAGDRFVRRGWSGIVELFDAVSGQLLFTTHSLPSASEGMLHFDRTGQHLAAARVGGQNDGLGLWSVADAREYRSVVHMGNGVNDESYLFGPAIHPDGRLVALSLTDGVALFDLDTGKELAPLPISDKRARAVSFDRSGNLLTNGFEGFFRRPVRSDAANPGRLKVGPPERLAFHPGHRDIAASHDGRVIAQCMWNGYGMAEFAGGWILHPTSPTPRRVAAGHSIGSCSVSPDGRWVGFGGPAFPLEVFDAASGQRVWQSPVVTEGGLHGRFSPDGRWLATDVDGGRLYAAGTWEPGPQLGPGTPWDLTSDLAVLGQTNGIYRLVEVATGRELARLEDPEQNTGRAALTPDGTKLVVAARNGLRVWDLRRIRAELAKLGLDWDAPPYPADGEKKDRPPLQVTVDLTGLAPPDPRADLVNWSVALALEPLNPGAYFRRGCVYSDLRQWRDAVADFTRAIALGTGGTDAEVWFRRGYANWQLGRRRQTVADYSRALELNPKHALAWNNRGVARASMGEPASALADYAHAVELKPDGALYWNNRGDVYYQLGQYEKAAADYSKALGLKPQEPWHWLNRGNAYTNLGRWDEAVVDYTRFLELTANQEGSGDAYLGRAGANSRLDRFPEARADYDKALGLMPQNARAHNDLAWFLATCPEARFRDPRRAVVLAGKAVERAPTNGSYWNTLGVAHYRAESWKEAIEALTKAMALRGGGDAADWLPLAMAHWQLGNRDEARRWYDRAVRWAEENQDKLTRDPLLHDAVRRFRAEAAALLDGREVP